MHTREEKTAAFGRLLDIMDALREKCPWNAAQTIDSIRPMTEEEVYDLGMERHEIVVGFEVGDTVKVTDGPLEGFLGTVDELEPEENRVRVVVSMFGRETPVDLELDQVEIIKE